MDRAEQVIELVRRLDALADEQRHVEKAIAVVRGELEQTLAGRNGRRPIVTRSILSALQEDPTIPNGALAVKIYGSDTPRFRGRIRSQIHLLRKRGLLQPDPGKRPCEVQADADGRAANAEEKELMM